MYSINVISKQHFVIPIKLAKFLNWNNLQQQKIIQVYTRYYVAIIIVIISCRLNEYTWLYVAIVTDITSFKLTDSLMNVLKNITVKISFSITQTAARAANMDAVMKFENYKAQKSFMLQIVAEIIIK